MGSIPIPVTGSREITRVKKTNTYPRLKLCKTRCPEKDLLSRVSSLIINFTEYMFIRKKGRTKIMWLPWTTGQVTAKNGLVVFSSGRLIPATSTTEGYATAGVAVKAITSASPEYTTASNIPVRVPIEKYVEWEADVTATLVVGDVGLHCDLTDQSTVNRGASSYDIVTITKFVSATKAWVVLNIGPGAIKGQV